MFCSFDHYSKYCITFSILLVFIFSSSSSSLEILTFYLCPSDSNSILNSISYPFPNLFFRCYTVPKHLKAPSTIIPTFVASASASSIVCVVTIMALFFESCLIIFHIFLLEAGSTPADYSSRKTIYGLPISAIAAQSFLLFPPLNLTDLTFSYSSKPNAVYTLFTSCSIPSYEIPFNEPMSIRCSYTVRQSVSGSY